VERVQVTRQSLDVLQRHRHHAGVAVAGGHAIDHAFLVQQRVEKLRALGNALAIGDIILQLRGHLTVGQGQYVFNAQSVFAKGYRLKMRRHRSSRKGKS
jgi:peptidoglycan/xylan/chitin deacetylase (PgdA/CDA1 family)